MARHMPPKRRNAPARAAVRRAGARTGPRNGTAGAAPAAPRPAEAHGVPARPVRSQPGSSPTRGRGDVRNAPHSALLAGLGRALRALRRRDVITRQSLAEKSGLSLRFLAQLEAGEGNVSIGKLEALASAFRLTAPALLAAAQAESAEQRGPGESRPALLAEITSRLLAVPSSRLEAILHGLETMTRQGEERSVPPLIALVGLRGAGKSTLGPRLAHRLGLPFHEMDDLIAEQSGLALPEIFEMHGEGYYRDAERRALETLIEKGARAVVAVSGGIVTDPAALDLLRRRTRLIWLRATPEQHMARVEAQGDYRPMRNRPNAMTELKSLLRQRTPLYRQAHAIVNTSSGSADASLAALLAALGPIVPDARPAR